MMVPRSVGYIKQTGDGLDGPPVIVYNHRRVIPGLLSLTFEHILLSFNSKISIIDHGLFIVVSSQGD